MHSKRIITIIMRDCLVYVVRVVYPLRPGKMYYVVTVANDSNNNIIGFRIPREIGYIL